MTKLQPVLLSGGSGTRLWPLSREAYPKQFLPLVGDDTMLQETWLRVAPLAGAAPIVVANEEHRFLVAEQLRQVGVDRRPRSCSSRSGRNTAPAIAAAALQATADGDDPLLLVLPSDHVVRDAGRLPRRRGRRRRRRRRSGALVTFGIVPEAPETGYGYIQAAGAVKPGAARAACCASSRSPTPPPRRRISMRAAITGTAACSCSAPRAICEELERFRPDILAAVRAAFAAAQRDGDFMRLDKEAFAACPSDSIDYAVMEKTDARDGAAGRHRLERRRLVVGAVGGEPSRMATATPTTAT